MDSECREGVGSVRSLFPKIDAGLATFSIVPLLGLRYSPRGVWRESCGMTV